MIELKLGLEQWFLNFGFSAYWANLIGDAIFFISLLLISYTANIIVKKSIPLIVTRLVSKTKTNWDDIMLKRKVFTRLSQLAPILIIFYGIPQVFPEAPDFILLVQKAVRIYLVFWIALIINSFLHSLNDIYESYDSAAERPIKGYIQVVQIIVYVLAVIVMLSIIMNKSVTYLFAGLGTMSAVLMIVFKDGLLGLTAGIQMSINKTVRIGDWISVPAQNADGTVIEITLNNIKVKNFDNTITVIPSYAFVSGSFQNWRGMQESGGRRIKRAILIDQTSIKFCTEEMLEKFKKIELIKEYVTERMNEIDEYNSQNVVASDLAINGRRMTNLGTYRKYITEYLQNHPMVNTELTAMVRQLAPTEKGIPLELYFFSKEKVWVLYEGIQSDIFDHLLASIETFELRVFQEPSGHDMRQLVK
ncbi:MAG TPA: mechanosensitive ion channel [Salinivirgaceae bacterium]|nr:mechanosensitive ion channel [Salinivirgaceae bacterium]HQA75909.1 mechanosensitive ion channel [Salinivirgaceae bacterium]